MSFLQIVYDWLQYYKHRVIQQADENANIIFITPSDKLSVTWILCALAVHFGEYQSILI